MKYNSSFFCSAKEELEELINTSLGITPNNIVEDYLSYAKYRDAIEINIYSLYDIEKYDTSKKLYKFILHCNNEIILNNPLSIENCILDCDNTYIRVRENKEVKNNEA